MKTWPSSVAPTMTETPCCKCYQRRHLAGCWCDDLFCLECMSDHLKICQYAISKTDKHRKELIDAKKGKSRQDHDHKRRAKGIFQNYRPQNLR